MRRGDGALVMVTRKGALEAGHPARRALRSLSPTGWAHASACAWVSAWLHLRGREWISEREILDDDFWRFDLRYQDHRGTVRRTHRPDLGVHTLSGPVAIEVELQPKTAARLRGICWMYAQLSEDDAPLNGVIYITDRNDVARLVTRSGAYDGSRVAAAAHARRRHSADPHGCRWPWHGHGGHQKNPACPGRWFANAAMMDVNRRQMRDDRKQPRRPTLHGT